MIQLMNIWKYLKYEYTKERLENELENIIKSELDILISDNYYEKIFEENKNKNNSNVKELIEDYLNKLIEIKIDMTDTILNEKDFKVFSKNDIEKTKEIIDYIKKEDIENNEREDNNNYNEENDINKIKNELENAKKEELELIGKYTKLLEKRDKYIKNSLRIFNYGKHSIRSYSSKLININMTEEKPFELSDGEKNEERCNCNLYPFKKCIIF